jgi:hypothetical protein
MRAFIKAAATASALGVLAVPAVASAAPGSRTFQQTYPVASHLCTVNPLPKTLLSQQAQVTSNCTTLQNAYGPAVSTVQGALTTYSNTVAQARSTVSAACQPTPTTAAGRKACRQARRQQRQTVHLARMNRRLAVDQFRTSVEQARVTFWNSIHQLRGGASIPADSPAASVPLPTPSA